jgi:excisionase family DNA binding protein
MHDADESIGKYCALGLKVVDGKSIMKVTAVRSSPAVNNPNTGKRGRSFGQGEMPMNATTKVKDVLTTGEVAKICNVAPRTVSKWFDSGALHGYRIPGSKDRRIPLNQLIRFMKMHGMPLNGLMTGCTRVLIVDEEQDIVEVLEKILEDEAKYEVEVAKGGFAAGITAEKFRPHVILLDMNLRDIDGREVCKHVKSNSDLQLTKVIAMSGKMTPEDAKGLLGSGFDGFLRKPFHVRQVIEAIEDVMAVVY